MLQNNRVGDVPAVQQQYGRNFSVSVIPYRSRPLIYTSRASLLKDMPKPWPTMSRCPRCGASYQVVRIEDGWNAETVRGLLARLWGGLSRAETDVLPEILPHACPDLNRVAASSRRRLPGNCALSYAIARSRRTRHCFPIICLFFLSNHFVGTGKRQCHTSRPPGARLHV